METHIGKNTPDAVAGEKQEFYDYMKKVGRAHAIGTATELLLHESFVAGRKSAQQDTKRLDKLQDLALNHPADFGSILWETTRTKNLRGAIDREIKQENQK